MAQPLHTSFTLRPCANGSKCGEQPQLTLHPDSFRRQPKRSYTLRQYHPYQQHPTFETREQCRKPNGRRQMVNVQYPFEFSVERKQLQQEFEPPVDEDYWKKRCFQWQDLCQKSRKRVRVMEEDQRQLRRRIWELENMLAYNQNNLFGHNNRTVDDEKVQVSVSSSSADDERPPTVISVPKNSQCCLYLTDGEGLSDVDDYEDDYVDDDFEEDIAEKNVDRSTGSARREL